MTEWKIYWLSNWHMIDEYEECVDRRIVGKEEIHDYVINNDPYLISFLVDKKYLSAKHRYLVDGDFGLVRIYENGIPVLELQLVKEQDV